MSYSLEFITGTDTLFGEDYSNKPKRRKKRETEWFDGCTKCYICEKTFASRSSLEIHLRIHTGEKPYKCTICDKSFTQKGHIKRHYLTHNAVFAVTCKLCSKTFQDSKSLKIHLKDHVGLESRYKCDKCDKSYTRLASLEIHQRIHIEGGYFKCKQCPEDSPYRFESYVALRRHVAEEHKRPSHPCSICGKIYEHRSDLAIHSRSHSNERPYNCFFCGKGFKSVSHVNRHERLHQKGSFKKSASSKEKRKDSKTNCNNTFNFVTFPFNCAHCDSGFCQRKNLVWHMKEHLNINKKK